MNIVLLEGEKKNFTSQQHKNHPSPLSEVTCGLLYLTNHNQL